MMWKIVFWIDLVLSVLGSYVIVSKAPLSILDLISLAFGILLTLCLYGYSYNRKLFSQKTWKTIYWILLFMFIESLIELLILPRGFIEQYLPFWKTSISYTSGEAWLSLVISLPALYASYKLAND